MRYTSFQQKKLKNFFMERLSPKKEMIFIKSRDRIVESNRIELSQIRIRFDNSKISNRIESNPNRIRIDSIRSNQMRNTNFMLFNIIQTQLNSFLFNN